MINQPYSVLKPLGLNFGKNRGKFEKLWSRTDLKSVTRAHWVILVGVCMTRILRVMSTEKNNDLMGTKPEMILTEFWQII